MTKYIDFTAFITRMGLLAPQRGIELLAQGNALGKMMSENSPCKGKSI